MSGGLKFKSGWRIEALRTRILARPDKSSAQRLLKAMLVVKNQLHNDLNVILLPCRVRTRLGLSEGKCLPIRLHPLPSTAVE